MSTKFWWGNLNEKRLLRRRPTWEDNIKVDLKEFGSTECIYEGWNFNSGNYLFTTDTKQIHVSKFYCPSL